jgi:hypothetical protein
MPFPVLYLAEEKLTSFWECFGDESNDQPEEGQALYEKAHLDPRQWVHHCHLFEHEDAEMMGSIRVEPVQTPHGN